MAQEGTGLTISDVRQQQQQQSDLFVSGNDDCPSPGKLFSNVYLFYCNHREIEISESGSFGANVGVSGHRPFFGLSGNIRPHTLI